MRLGFLQGEAAGKNLSRILRQAQDGSKDGERNRTIDPERPKEVLSEIEGRVKRVEGSRVIFPAACCGGS